VRLKRRKSVADKSSCKRSLNVKDLRGCVFNSLSQRKSGFSALSPRKMKSYVRPSLSKRRKQRSCVLVKPPRMRPLN
jgi:hypothetical protein